MAKSKKDGKLVKQEKCFLVEQETNVLRELLREWNNLPDKKTRDAFVTATVLPKIQQLNLEKYGPDRLSICKESRQLWERRVKSVFTWFKNNKPYKEKTVFKIERTMSLRWVVGRVKSAEIEQLVNSEHPDVQKGGKSYPGCYQKCLTKYMDSMNDEERSCIELERQKWQKEGPPMEIRVKACKKYSQKAISKMHSTLYKEMNVHCLTFDFHQELDGRTTLICHDYISDLCGQDGGDKFLAFHHFDPTGYANVMQTILDYTRYVRQKREKKGDAEEDELKGKFNGDLILKGPGGLPLLPAPCIGPKGAELADIVKAVLREYFTAHYRLATRNPNAKVPWKAIGNNPGNFLNPECIPDGVQLLDPSRMGQSVKLLVDHLRKREDEFGVNAFKFDQVEIKGILKAADYPPETQKVIDAGKAVKNWPTAGSIHTNRLTHTLEDDEVKVEDMNDMALVADSGALDPGIENLEQKAESPGGDMAGLTMERNGLGAIEMGEQDDPPSVQASVAGTNHWAADPSASAIGMEPAVERERLIAETSMKLDTSAMMSQASDFYKSAKHPSFEDMNNMRAASWPTGNASTGSAHLMLGPQDNATGWIPQMQPNPSIVGQQSNLTAGQSHFGHQTHSGGMLQYPNPYPYWPPPFHEQNHIANGFQTAPPYAYGGVVPDPWGSTMAYGASYYQGAQNLTNNQVNATVGTQVFPGGQPGFPFPLHQAQDTIMHHPMPSGRADLQSQSTPVKVLPPKGTPSPRKRPRAETHSSEGQGTPSRKSARKTATPKRFNNATSGVS